MHHSLRHRHNRLGRLLSLLALVAVLGGQLLESGHSHAFLDPATQCLLCQGAGPALTGNSTLHIAPESTAIVPEGAVIPGTIVAPISRYTPRGPPINT